MENTATGPRQPVTQLGNQNHLPPKNNIHGPQGTATDLDTKRQGANGINCSTNLERTNLLLMLCLEVKSWSCCTMGSSLIQLLTCEYSPQQKIQAA